MRVEGEKKLLLDEGHVIREHIERSSGMKFNQSSHTAGQQQQNCERNVMLIGSINHKSSALNKRPGKLGLVLISHVFPAVMSNNNRLTDVYSL